MMQFNHTYWFALMVVLCRPITIYANDLGGHYELNVTMNHSLDSGGGSKTQAPSELEMAGTTSSTNTLFPPYPGKGGGGGQATVPLFNRVDQLLGYSEKWNNLLLMANRPVHSISLEHLQRKYAQWLPQTLADSPDSTSRFSLTSSGSQGGSQEGSQEGNKGESTSEDNDANDIEDYYSDDQDGADDDKSAPKASCSTDSSSVWTELLFQAIGENDDELVEQCLTMGANYNARNDENETPLILAASGVYTRKQLRIFTMLLDQTGIETSPNDVQSLPVEVLLDRVYEVADHFHPQGFSMIIRLIEAMKGSLNSSQLSPDRRQVLWWAIVNKMANMATAEMSPEQLSHSRIPLIIQYQLGQSRWETTMNLNIVQWLALFGNPGDMQVFIKAMSNASELLQEMVNSPVRLSRRINWQLYPLNFAAARIAPDIMKMLMNAGALIDPADSAVANNDARVVFRSSELSFRPFSGTVSVCETVFQRYDETLWDQVLAQIDARPTDREKALVMALEIAAKHCVVDELLLSKIISMLNRTLWSAENTWLIRSLLSDLSGAIRKIIIQRNELGSVKVRRVQYYVLVYGALLDAYHQQHTDIDWTGWSAHFFDDAPEQPKSHEEGRYASVNWAVSHGHLPLTIFHMSRQVFQEYRSRQKGGQDHGTPPESAFTDLHPLNVASRTRNGDIVRFLLTVGACPLLAERPFIESGSDASPSPFSIFHFVFAGNDSSLSDLVIFHLLAHRVSSEEVFWLQRAVKIAIDADNMTFLMNIVEGFPDLLANLDLEVRQALHAKVPLGEYIWEEDEALSNLDKSSSGCESLPGYRSAYEEGINKCPYRDLHFDVP